MTTLVAALRLSLILAPLAVASPWRGPPAADARTDLGVAVAVGDGQVFVGEAPFVGNGVGRVHVYGRDPQGRWIEQAVLTASQPKPGDGFGGALAVEDRTLVVGGGQVHAWVFERDDASAWHQSAILESPGTTALGYVGGVAVSGDWVMIGAPYEGGNVGGGGTPTVHFYRRTGPDRWAHATGIAASDPANMALFGYGVSMEGPNAMTISRAGIHIFRRESEAWREVSMIDSVAAPGVTRTPGAGILVRGDEAMVGASVADSVGRVFLLARDGASGRWAITGQLVAPDSTRQPGYSSPFFGSYASGVGDETWIAAPWGGTGATVYRFERPGPTGSWRLAERIRPEGSEAPSGTWMPVAMGATVAAVGLPQMDFGLGRVKIYEKAARGWSEAKILLGEEVPPLDAVTGGEVRCERKAAIFDCGNVDLVSFLPIRAIGGKRGVQLSSIWGWTDPDTGREYAIVGRVDGAAIVDISEPTRPAYVAEIPRTPGSRHSYWREIKVYKDHAYIVSDAAGEHGMQVVDLTRVRQYQGSTLVLTPDATYRGINSAHNVVINEESGLAVATGSQGGGQTCGGGLHMIDIREPKNPTFAGCFSDPETGNNKTGYSHDAQCVTYRGPDPDYRGREICIGSNETAISVADVTDRSHPKAISRASYPNVGYAHQGWFTGDQRYFFMNDEWDELSGKVPNTRTIVWDMADLDDPVVAKEYFGPTKAVDHNLFINGNLMYQSNYVAGLRVVDVSDPLNPIEVGFLDTQPSGTNDDTAFSGTWGNYPFFKSGVIAVSSIEQGLFLVRYSPRPVF